MSINILYVIVAIVGSIFGITYISRRKCMPYHMEALDKDWNSIPKEVKILCLALMRVAGGGYIVMSVSILALLYLKAHESVIGNILILIIGIIGIGPSVWVANFVKKNTNGNPPILIGIITILILLSGFIVSLFK